MKEQTIPLSEEDISLLKKIAGNRRASMIGQVLFSIPALFLVVSPYMNLVARGLGISFVVFIHLIFSFYRKQRNRIHQDIRSGDKHLLEGELTAAYTKGTDIRYTIDRKEISVKLPTAHYDYHIIAFKTVGGPVSLQKTTGSNTMLAIRYPGKEATVKAMENTILAIPGYLRVALVIAGAALVLMTLLMVVNILDRISFYILSATVVVVFLIVYMVASSERKEKRKGKQLQINGSVTETFTVRVMASRAAIRYRYYIRIGDYLLLSFHQPQVTPGDTVSVKALVPAGADTGYLEEIITENL